MAHVLGLPLIVAALVIMGSAQPLRLLAAALPFEEVAAPLTFLKGHRRLQPFEQQGPAKAHGPIDSLNGNRSAHLAGPFA